MNILNIILTGIAGLSAYIALRQAKIAKKQANTAEEQAEAAKEQAEAAKKQAEAAKKQAEAAKEATSVIKAERKREIVEKCLHMRGRGGWERYVESLGLSKEDKKDIIESVNIAFGKKKKD